MKNVFIRIGIIFLAVTVGIFLIYAILCMSTFFVANIANIPVVGAIAYGIAIALAIATTAIVFKDIKKVGITVAILAGLTLITATIYTIIANFSDFKVKISSLVSGEFAIGFLIAVLFMGFSVFANYLFFTKKKK